MIIVNKCGDRHCNNPEYYKQVEKCHAGQPEGWNGKCIFREGAPLKDFSVPNPKEGSMVNKDEFRQHLINMGCVRTTWANGEVWHRDKPTRVYIPLDKAGLKVLGYAVELRQCANDMVDLEAFTEYLAETDTQWEKDTHCPHCGEYLPHAYHRVNVHDLV